MHPDTVVYLEHDGKLLLVNQQGQGPQECLMGRETEHELLRFPTIGEVQNLAIPWNEIRQTDVKFSGKL